jgi:hypothetical protein
MSVTLPSEELRALGDSPGAEAILTLGRSWLAKPDALYRLPTEEGEALDGALRRSYHYPLLAQLREARSEAHERQPKVIVERARAAAVVIEALKDPQALYELPAAEWGALLETARQTGPTSYFHNIRSLEAARDQVRDAQPDVVEAHQAVKAALENPSAIIKFKPKEWSRLLKTADTIPANFAGRYDNYRQMLVQAKTDALIASRIEATPSSSIKHLGIHGEMSLALVRKVDAVIGGAWLTVPRLGVARNRKEMTYKNGIPEAQLGACDAPWGPFHGIPEGGSRGTTSIICELKSATLLKMFGLTAFDVNVSPELESYFRTLEPFPWEKEGST